jgi:TonB family protein
MIGRILALCALLINVAATEPEVRAPTGKWTVEFADHDCILSRPYERTRNDSLILSFKKLPVEPGIDLFVFKYRGGGEIRDGKADLNFGSGRPGETKFVAYPTVAGLRMIVLHVDDDAYKAAVQSGQVRLSVPREVHETFAVPGLGPALKLLDQCALNLGELWGIPKEQQLRVSAPAKLDTRSLFSSGDYPISAIRKEASGRTVLRVTVDEVGKPLDCVILKSSGEKSLDTRSCTVLMRRAQYQPAQDVAGKPIRSVSVTIIDWMLL